MRRARDTTTHRRRELFHGPDVLIPAHALNPGLAVCASLLDDKVLQTADDVCEERARSGQDVKGDTARRERTLNRGGTSEKDRGFPVTVLEDVSVCVNETGLKGGEGQRQKSERASGHGLTVIADPLGAK